MLNLDHSMTVATDATVAELISRASERLVILAPAVTKEVAEAVRERASVMDSGSITVILDSDPETYRLGYGDLEGLHCLQAAGEEFGFTLRRQPGLRICVVVVDDKTLVFTPTPRLIEAGPNTFGAANAIFIGAPPSALLKDVMVPSNGDARLGREELSFEDVERVKVNLEKNPPQQFDIARRMRVFNAFYEFAELELSGVQIDRKQVRIPNHLNGLASKSARERLRSTFQLIADGDKLSGLHLRQDRDLIARRFMLAVPKFGNLVERAHKEEFQHEVEGLRKRVVAFKKELEEKLGASMQKSLSELVKALLPAVRRRPPIEWCLSDGTKPSAGACEKFLLQDLTKAFGSASQLIGGMEVRLQFKGITHETLTNSDFLDAGHKAGLDVSRLHEEYDAAKASQQAALFADVTE